MKLSRRSTFTLIAGGALGGAALATGVGVMHVALDDEDLVKAVLERHFGPFTMDSAEVAAFFSDFLELEYWRFPPEKLAMIYGAAERFNLAETLHQALPGARGDILEDFERHLVAAFLSQTDFSFRADISEPVKYLGAGACINPFAQFA